MPETVDAWEKEIAVAAGSFSFVQAVRIVDKNPVALKVRLVIGPDFFVQIYVNVETGTQNFVLVLGRQRLYGRDCVGGNWHRHKYEEPEAHDFSPEGTRPITASEFLAEVREVVEEARLL